MAVRPVLRMGHPTLLQTARPVSEFNTAALDALIQDMFDTMAEKDGVGLAAPQIGESQRIVIFGVEENPRYPNAEVVPTTVLINPEIDIIGTEQLQSWEGCLSIPGMRGLVPRYTHLRYSGFDQHGNTISREVTDFHAVVVQHECDHLDGVLYPQRILDMRQFGFIEELDAQQQEPAE
ncbi:peptide deformylase [Pseudomonadota bacterium]